MFSIILYQPQIPPNTGNIIRLCANTHCMLHLIEPLGFSLDDKQLQRAALDYRHLARVQVHSNLSSCLLSLPQARLFALTSKGKTRYTQTQFQPNDAFLFGCETQGLPQALLATFSADHLLTIPQYTTSRSLNLANSVAIVIYEAWRQMDFIHI